jgi:hypothetical protein
MVTLCFIWSSRLAPGLGWPTEIKAQAARAVVRGDETETNIRLAPIRVVGAIH